MASNLASIKQPYSFIQYINLGGHVKITRKSLEETVSVHLSKKSKGRQKERNQIKSSQP